MRSGEGPTHLRVRWMELLVCRFIWCAADIMRSRLATNEHLVCEPCHDLPPTTRDGQPEPSPTTITASWSKVRWSADQEWRRLDASAERVAANKSYRRWAEKRTHNNSARPPHTSGDVVYGLWTCCKQLAPNASGCLQGPHAFDLCRCVNCGEWVSVEQWSATDTCRYHEKPPERTRWGAAKFPCCGATGLKGTK